MDPSIRKIKVSWILSSRMNICEVSTWYLLICRKLAYSIKLDIVSEISLIFYCRLDNLYFSLPSSSHSTQNTPPNDHIQMLSLLNFHHTHYTSICQLDWPQDASCSWSVKINPFLFIDICDFLSSTMKILAL